MRQWKGYLAGLLAAALLCGLAGTAYARSGKVTQELEYRNIRVTLDGKTLDLRNAVGETVEPFMFGGTNYLPVRALAECLGLHVAWNGQTSTVVLTTPSPVPEAESKVPAALAAVDAMEGLDFEYWTAALLRLRDFENVEVTQASGDQGVDVTAEKDGIRYAIQCKRYSSNLGNDPVQEVFTGKTVYRAHVGAVITNQRFTAGAKELAETNGVLLWDRDWIEGQLKKLEAEGRDVMFTAARPAAAETAPVETVPAETVTPVPAETATPAPTVVETPVTVPTPSTTTTPVVTVPTPATTTPATTTTTTPSKSIPSGSATSGGGNGNNFNYWDLPENQQTTAAYVLNTHTMKIHAPTCREVPKIAPQNYATSNETISALTAQGYTVCGVCNGR